MSEDPTESPARRHLHATAATQQQLTVSLNVVSPQTLPPSSCTSIQKAIQLDLAPFQTSLTGTPSCSLKKLTTVGAFVSGPLPLPLPPIPLLPYPLRDILSVHVLDDHDSTPTFQSFNHVLDDTRSAFLAPPPP